MIAKVGNLIKLLNQQGMDITISIIDEVIDLINIQ